VNPQRHHVSICVHFVIRTMGDPGFSEGGEGEMQRGFERTCISRCLAPNWPCRLWNVLGERCVWSRARRKKKRLRGRATTGGGTGWASLNCRRLQMGRMLGTAIATFPPLPFFLPRSLPPFAERYAKPPAVVRHAICGCAVGGERRWGAGVRMVRAVRCGGADGWTENWPMSSLVWAWLGGG